VSTLKNLGDYGEPALAALIDATASALRHVSGVNIMGEQVEPRLTAKLIAALKRASPYMLEDCWCEQPDRGGKDPHSKLCRKVRAALAKARRDGAR
jgi:hypothetical protein